ncbi:cation:proton antiporter [Vallitalea pronyensis]|uniref:Cation:proton antiporter n=1 Tax=Vallitalea pronyensis TaxID=1348613 RepID=A0A8J8MMX9_9FIRM|nr:cation:proton antiporter [Vallitalea pronyensis]QUI24481.1 cation:proton antiporter [Vallitalea pronyensis]
MHTDTHFIQDLVIILLATGIGSYIFKKLRLSMVLGQIIGGVIIGPSLLGIISQTEFVSNLSEIGVILLMFIAGLETDYEKLKDSFNQSFLIAIGGILVPFVLGAGALFLIKPSVVLSEAIFLGIILTATSIGIAVKLLSETKLLPTKLGMCTLGATIIDDIAGVIILTLALGAFGSQHTNVSGLVFKIAIFFILLVVAGHILIKFISKNRRYLKAIKPVYMLRTVLCTTFIFAIYASNLGMAAILGAYFIGLIISTTSLKKNIKGEISKFGSSFFIPIFFTNIGIGLDLGEVTQFLPLAILITVIGIASKIIGAGLGAKLSGFRAGEALKIGVCMVPRAEVTLIVANLALRLDMIGKDIFTSIILLVIMSAIFSPVALKCLVKRR